jgi:hypothetical protein
MPLFKKTFLVVLLLLQTTYAAPQPPVSNVPVSSLREKGWQCFNSGNLVAGDSLWRIADTTKALLKKDYFKWLEIKAVLSQYNDAAKICCKISALDPRQTPSALDALMHMLADQSLSVKKEALQTYSEYALSSIHADTLRFLLQLNRLYSSFDLYDEQDNLFLLLDKTNQISANELFNAAQERFHSGKYSQSLFPATLAYKKFTNDKEQSSCAYLLFLCWQKTGVPDSALFWLDKTTFFDPSIKVQAIPFLQTADFLKKADSLISTLNLSLTKDTLKIRQFLFEHNLKDAFDAAEKIDKVHYKEVALVWTIRTAIFSENTSHLEGWIDTVSFSLSSSFSEELLQYRLRFTLFKTNSGLFHEYCQRAYALWLNTFSIVELTQNKNIPKNIRDMFTCDLLKSLLSHGRYADAEKISVSLSLESASAELLFYCASIFINQKKFPEAKATLEQLIVSFPADVFSKRASLLLSGLNQKN